jgi:hypothetical protein
MDRLGNKMNADGEQDSSTDLQVIPVGYCREYKAE